MDGVDWTNLLQDINMESYFCMPIEHHGMVLGRVNIISFTSLYVLPECTKKFLLLFLNIF